MFVGYFPCRCIRYSCKCSSSHNCYHGDTIVKWCITAIYASVVIHREELWQYLEDLGTSLKIALVIAWEF